MLHNPVKHCLQKKTPTSEVGVAGNCMLAKAAGRGDKGGGSHRGLESTWNTCYSASMNLIDLTPTQLKRLAALAKTTYGTLRHVAAGRRGMSSEAAIRIERGAKRMGLDVRRESLNAGCEMCEFAKACRRAK